MKIDRIRFVETETTHKDGMYKLEWNYDGHDPLDWCLRGYKYHLMSLWANAGLVDGDGAPLIHLCHVSDEEVYERYHDFLCTFDPWEVKYYGIEQWPERIEEGINWHKKHPE